MSWALWGSYPFLCLSMLWPTVTYTPAWVRTILLWSCLEKAIFHDSASEGGVMRSQRLCQRYAGIVLICAYVMVAIEVMPHKVHDNPPGWGSDSNSGLPQVCQQLVLYARVSRKYPFKESAMLNTLMPHLTGVFWCILFGTKMTTKSNHGFIDSEVFGWSIHWSEGLDHCKLTNECMGVAEVENPERLDGRTLSWIFQC